MMDATQKRASVLNMLRNTFIKSAQIDDTISERKLLNEICMKHGISHRTALQYILELVEMGVIKRDNGLLWHSKEGEIRTDYLEKVKEEEKAIENTLKVNDESTAQ